MQTVLSANSLVMQLWLPLHRISQQQQGWTPAAQTTCSVQSACCTAVAQCVLQAHTCWKKAMSFAARQAGSPSARCVSSNSMTPKSKYHKDTLIVPRSGTCGGAPVPAGYCSQPCTLSPTMQPQVPPLLPSTQQTIRTCLPVRCLQRHPCACMSSPCTLSPTRHPPAVAGNPHPHPLTPNPATGAHLCPCQVPVEVLLRLQVPHLALKHAAPTIGQHGRRQALPCDLTPAATQTEQPYSISSLCFGTMACRSTKYPDCALVV
jgi:hypothetical protein